MDTVSDILEALGGVSAVAAETGIPLTTVHSWKRTGFVPRWRIPTLVHLGDRIGTPISEASFPKRRKSAETGASQVGTGSIDHGADDAAAQHASSTGQIADKSTPAAQVMR